MDDPRNEEFWKFKIATLNLGPGDVLVISLPAKANDSQKAFAGQWASGITRLVGARCFVKTDDVSLMIASPKDTVRIKTGKVEIGRLIQRQHSMTGDASSHMIIDDPHDR